MQLLDSTSVKHGERSRRVSQKMRYWSMSGGRGREDSSSCNEGELDMLCPTQLEDSTAAQIDCLASSCKLKMSAGLAIPFRGSWLRDISGIGLKRGNFAGGSS